MAKPQPPETIPVPELPEVETTRQGIAPHCESRRIAGVTVRNGQLRWPVPDDLSQRLTGRTVEQVARRAKYLLLHLDDGGTVIVHLGMSGSLRVITDHSPPQRHDHIDLQLDSGACLRFNDPRRFGCWLWSPNPEQHPLLAGLGPEPLAPEFDGVHLHRLARGRSTPVKAFIMDHHVVVGVGNIYANEALFQAGIHPRRPPAASASTVTSGWPRPFGTPSARPYSWAAQHCGISSTATVSQATSPSPCKSTAGAGNPAHAAKPRCGRSGSATAAQCTARPANASGPHRSGMEKRLKMHKYDS